MGELAAGVAHEINNPLTVIHGLSELLQKEDWPTQVSEDGRKIQEATQRAASVVQKLLSFARKSEPEKRYLDVVPVVNRGLELKARDFELGNIRVSNHHVSRIPYTMLDENQLIQVILNVLTNAEHAIQAREGAGEITIATRLTNNKILISICDDGLGNPRG